MAGHIHVEPAAPFARPRWRSRRRWPRRAPQTAPGLQTLEVVPLPRDGEVLVSFKLNETLTDDIRKAIQSGLTIKFVYKVDLRRSSSVWVDRTLAIGAGGRDASVRHVDPPVPRGACDRRPHGKSRRHRARRRRLGLADADFSRLSLFRGVRSSPTPSTYVRVRANASPRGASFIWPWAGDDAVGLAKFTFMR